MLVYKVFVLSFVKTVLKSVLAPGRVVLSASSLAYNVGVDLNVILQLFPLVMLLIVYVFPESVPPHV